MKKHLIAAAVAGALAVPAMAQVTVSGRIDTSVQSVDNGTNKATAIEDNLLTTNQLVLSGSEDLGGGLKAGFSIVSGFGSDINGNLNFGDRGAALNVSGGFGSIELGKTTGTMINSTSASGLNGNIGNLTAVEARPDNMIGYTTPEFSGITARIVYGVGTETPGNTSGDGAQTEYSVQYKAGTVLARVAYASFETATASTTAGVFGDTGVKAFGGATADDLTQLGAQLDVDFGMAKVNVRYTKVEFDSAANDVRGTHTQYGIGAAIPVGNGLTAVLDYAAHDGENDSEVTRTSLALVKSLSKRTNVYGAYAANDKDSDLKIFAVGVRHSF